MGHRSLTIEILKCKKLSLISGTKLVLQPSLNLAECNTGKYQPFLFNTHGNSKCVFSKSKCNGDGQTVYSNGSLTNDIACGCDYSHGYAFVSKPKKSCFCIPSEEDCTCFRVECKKLSAGVFYCYLYYLVDLYLYRNVKKTILFFLYLFL